MIALTSGPAAAEAAAAALARGGSAMDAALTAAVAQTVLSAGSWDSFAGILSLLYYDAVSGEVHFLDAGYHTVRGETDASSIPSAGTRSGRTALVPGFVAGVAAAHQRFGRLPFADLFAPAIDLAEDGFRVEPALHELIAYRGDVLTGTSGGRKVFEKDTGDLVALGDRLRQPELAGTLRRVASEGAAHMYTGAWGQRFVAAVQAAGGAMTMDDLAGYEPTWSEPLRTTYGGRLVYTAGPSSFGGVCTVEALHLSEEAGLRHRAHYAASGETLSLLMQISHACYQSYFPFAPSASVRCQRETASALWREMQDEGGLSFLDRLKLGSGPAHTDAVVVVDVERNIAALGHSSNTMSWGSSGLFVDGVPIPDSASFQQPLIASVGPGSRLPNSLNPTLVFDGHQPVLAASAIGDSVHEVMLQYLVNRLDFDLDQRRSLESPMFMRPVWPASSAINLVLAGIAALVFLWVVYAWLGREAWRAARQGSFSLPAFARLVAGAASLLQLGFLIGLWWAYAGGGGWLLRALDRPGLAAGAAVALLAAVIAGWRRPDWPLRGRLGLAVVAFLVLAFIPFVDTSTRFHSVVEVDAFDPDVLTDVKARGQRLIEVERFAPRGYLAGVTIDPQTGALAGGVSPSSPGGIAVGD